MLRTRRGEREPMGSAVEALYAEHCVRAVRLAYLLTGDAGAAEELAHEAFVRIWRSGDGIRSADALPAYLRKTVLSLSRTFRRRKALELRHRFRTAEDGVGIDVPERIDVLGAVAQLPYGQRACIALRFYEPLPRRVSPRATALRPPVRPPAPAGPTTGSRTREHTPYASTSRCSSCFHPRSRAAGRQRSTPW